MAKKMPSLEPPRRALTSHVARGGWVLRLEFGLAAFCRGAEHRQHVLDFFSHQIARLEAFANEPFDPHVCEQGEQRAPKAADIRDEDRLCVAIELDPGQLLDQLFQRADSAWQGDKSVGAIEHRLLAFVHVLDDDHLLDSGQRMFLADEEAWNDPGDISASLERLPGDTPHQPFAAAAIDEADTPGRERPP